MTTRQRFAVKADFHDGFALPSARTRVSALASKLRKRSNTQEEGRERLPPELVLQIIEASDDDDVASLRAWTLVSRGCKACAQKLLDEIFGFDVAHQGDGMAVVRLLERQMRRAKRARGGGGGGVNAAYVDVRVPDARQEPGLWRTLASNEHVLNKLVDKALSRISDTNRPRVRLRRNFLGLLGAIAACTLVRPPLPLIEA